MSRRLPSPSCPNSSSATRTTSSPSTASGTESSTWNNLPVGSPILIPAPTTSSAPISINPPCIAAGSRAPAPAIAPPSRTRWSSSPKKPSHQLFLEPEGRHTDEYYVNGVSTSLPFEVQYEFIRTIPGLEHAEIMRPGYAVEYDFARPPSFSPPSRPSASPASTSPARSTAPPVTKRPPPRGSSPAPMPPSSSKRPPAHPRPRRVLYRRPHRRPRHKGHQRALPHVHQPRRASPPPPPGQRRFPPHPPRTGSRPRRSPRWESFLQKSVRPPSLEAEAPRIRVEGAELTRWLKRSDCPYTRLPEIRAEYPDDDLGPIRDQSQNTRGTSPASSSPSPKPKPANPSHPHHPRLHRSPRPSPRSPPKTRRNPAAHIRPGRPHQRHHPRGPRHRPNLAPKGFPTGGSSSILGRRLLW
jgi:hypothetical protein